MRAPLVGIRGLARSFETAAGRVEVLKDLELDIAEGDRIAIVGQSGVGKSTFLHILGTLDHPSAGSIRFRGEDVFARSREALADLRGRFLGFVFQFHHLLPEFNAADNIAMPLMIAGVSKSAARAKADELLGIMGLAERGHHQPAQMSGGEQQRVAIARALANTPRLVIADEPTGNLDPATTERVFATFIKMAREEGAAVLVATHNFALVQHMDRVLTLKDGKIVPYVAD